MNVLSPDQPTRAKTPPGPRGNLILGSLKEFQADTIGFMTDSVREYGDVVRFRFGHVVAILVNRPEYVEQVLAQGARNYDKNTRSVSKIRATCGGSLLSCDGEQWLRHRRLIQPVFQRQHVSAYGPAIESATEEMLERWGARFSAGQTIDIVSEMMGVTMTIAASVLFESDIRDQVEVIEKALEVILQDTWRRLESPIDLSVISSRLHRPRFRKALRSIDDVVFRIIDDRRQNGSVRQDLLSRLLNAHKAVEGRHFSDHELRDAVVTLLLAGHETTANALASAFCLISQSPQTERRIVEESFRQANTNVPQDLLEARKAFFESIRLYPSIWIIERRAVSKDQIGGFSIPHGSTVILSPYLLHRHKEFWKDPETFDSDRFEPGRIADLSRNAYIPFGLGPHRCIGEHMATLVATQILSRVYRQFRLRLVAGQAANPVPGITLRHEGELRMNLRRIDQEPEAAPLSDVR